MKFRSCLPLSAMGFVLLVSSVASLEIDRAELQEAGDAEIEFENYEGPVERIESREAIRGIGESIGQDLSRSSAADYASRYRAYRIIGDPLEPLRAADLLELDRSARVDHIVNLRRIIAGYLETAWEYRGEDADLLSRFITIYNAVHRGNVSFFSERYRTAVVDALNPERVGLATSYQEWAGQTQLVIPIRDERAPGDLDAVDPRQLIDPAVIAELRTRSDLGIEDRKAIISFIERVIEERTEVIAEERAAIEAAQEEIDQRQDEIRAEIATIEDAAAPPPARRSEAETVSEEPVSEDTLATVQTPTLTAPRDAVQDESVEKRAEEDETDELAPREQRVEGLQEKQEQLQVREEELRERREQLEEEEEEVEELTEEVEELYQDTAEDQAMLNEGGVAEFVPFAVSNGDGSFELSIVNIDTVDIVGEQTVPVATRDLVGFQGGILVTHTGSERLLLLNPTSLALLEESDTRVVPGAKIRIVGRSVLTVIEEGGGFYIGEFDPQLVLLRRSAESVKRETDIVNRGERLIVQGADGTLRRLDLQDFE